MKTQAMSNESTSAQRATTFNTIWLWWNILVTLHYSLFQSLLKTTACGRDQTTPHY